MTEQLSGVVRVPCKCPVQCQELCRYPAGALSGVVQVPRRCPVRSGAEIGLLSLRLSVFQPAALEDFLLAPVCPIEKVTQWESHHYLMSGSETDEGVAGNKVLDRTRNRTVDLGSKAQYASLRYRRYLYLTH